MDFINIIGTLFDNSIEHVVALAHQIKDLRLNKNQQDINEDIYNNIQRLDKEDLKLHEQINEVSEKFSQTIEVINEKNEEQDNKDNEFEERINNIEEENQKTEERLQHIEEGGIEAKESLKHKLITSSSYHNLAYYEKDVLYLVVDSFKENTSVFGDKFPLILGGVTDPSHFGDKFPIVLDGTDYSQESTHFGDKFPLIFGNVNYYTEVNS